MELVETSEEDRPLTVQIFGGEIRDLIKAARWLKDHGYEAIDINMAAHGQSERLRGGARLMCNVDGAVAMVAKVIEASDLP